MIPKTHIAALLLTLLLSQPAVAQDALFVRDAFDRIKGQRNQHDLSTLAYNKTLANAAQAHAEWMAGERKMEHLQAEAKSYDEFRTCDHYPINRAINAGYIGWEKVFTAVPGENGMGAVTKPDANAHFGEIIAVGWNAGHPASHTEMIVKGWMNSPGHRKEILTARHEEMGVGVACTPDGKDTFWCVMFGTPTKKQLVALHLAERSLF